MYQTNYIEFLSAMLMSSLERSPSSSVEDLNELLDFLERFGMETQ